MSATYRAAWVPDDDPRLDWNEAAALAIEWIENEATEQGKRVVLVTCTFNGATHGSPLARYTRPDQHVTPRGGFRGRDVPVLAFVPDMPTLEFAADLAHSSSLCVIETQSDPIHGWAAVTRAVNLLTGEQTKLDDALVELLDRLVFYGNNGYGDSWGKQNARRILDDMRAAGMTDRDFITSALAARGISLYGQKNIGKLIDGMQRGRR